MFCVSLINPECHALNGPAGCWMLSLFDKFVVQPKAEIWLMEMNPGEDAKSIQRVISDFEVTMYDRPFILSMQSRGLGNGESKIYSL